MIRDVHKDIQIDHAIGANWRSESRNLIRSVKQFLTSFFTVLVRSE